ncbi:MAG: DUF2848 domain-containing protein [Solirubrobacterales bacterium]
MTELTLDLGGEQRGVTIDTAIVAGWTARDKEALEHHMAELEALGVARPSAAPIFYRVSAARLTTVGEIEATEASSGEAEAVLLQVEGVLWVGIGSDHTDREVEAFGVAVSKQMCEKPIGASFWPYEEVAGHWDELRLRSWITEDGGEVLYQDGTLAAMLPPGPDRRRDPSVEDGTLMFGTLAAIGGIRPAATFRYELNDPILDRRLEANYSMRTLPLIS